MSRFVFGLHMQSSFRRRRYAISKRITWYERYVSVCPLSGGTMVLAPYVGNGRFPPLLLAIEQYQPSCEPREVVTFAMVFSSSEATRKRGKRQRRLLIRMGRRSLGDVTEASHPHCHGLS
ncbi:hypothetical protein B296_00008555 [Ensete ventricosum]|uniref:Uncharacterized protein n=1 Tax=Ensete ventricosum TaxID=4639 RepID=A0A427AZ78_ENSVE|nr:hypothetical protein B296_00008555 [Ensete ventricosum]